MEYCRVDKGQVVEIHNLAARGRMIRLDKEHKIAPKQKHYQAAGWLPVIRPALGANQILGAPIIKVDQVIFEVVDKTPQELEAELAANILAMYHAAREYIDRRLHWTAAPMIFDKAKGNKPNSKALMDWTIAVWQLYWQREDDLLAGTIEWDATLLDFSVLGDLPHPVREAFLE